MDLTKLFEMQRVLRDRIGYKQADRSTKLFLALLVEIGECANEQRSWKYWSKDQAPRTKKARGPYIELEDADFYNPLLEEFVDGLHFVLEKGLDFGCERGWFGHYTSRSIEVQYLNVFEDVIELWKCEREGELFALNGLYEELVNGYLGLGEMLGFTEDEIEKAYFAKNAINHQRQEVGY